MRTVQLTSATVELIEKLNWGQQEQIRTAMLGGIKVSGLNEKEKQNIELDPSVLVRAKYKALEICVTKITLTDGKVTAYSKEWMDNLSIEDGDMLFAAVNEVTDPKKK